MDEVEHTADYRNKSVCCQNTFQASFGMMTYMITAQSIIYEKTKRLDIGFMDLILNCKWCGINLGILQNTTYKGKGSIYGIAMNVAAA